MRKYTLINWQGWYWSAEKGLVQHQAQATKFADVREANRMADKLGYNVLTYDEKKGN